MTDTRPVWFTKMRSIEAAAVAGLIHAALLSIALAITQAHPSSDASEGEILAFYQDSASTGRMVLALNLAPLSIIAFLWFIGVIRRRLGEREDKLFSTVFLGGGLLFAALALVGFGAMGSPALSVEVSGSPPSIEGLRLMRLLGETILAVIAPRFAAVFVLTTSTLMLRAGAMPRWLTLLGQLIGLFMIVNFTISRPTPFVFPAWVAILSIYLLIHRAEMHRPQAG